jgi:hypothetical protein
MVGTIRLLRRIAHGRRIVLLRLISELRTRSPELARLWEARPLQERHTDRKRFAHPQLGEIELDCDVLTAPAEDHVLLVYFATPASRDAEALALLRVLGAEPLFEPAAEP